MSFLKSLFGGGSKAEPSAALQSEPENYKGYEITPAPISEDGQFRLSATVTKTIDGEQKSHRLIRADLFPTRQPAVEAAIAKARQTIDEQGDDIFSS